MREERPRSWFWGVFGSKVRSAAQGPSCLGGARGSARSVYTPPNLLPQTCQLGMVTASTASPGCQFCFVTWVSVTASLNLSFLPWNVGITPPPHAVGRDTWLGMPLLFPLLLSARIHVECLRCRGGDTPGPSPVGRQAGGPLVSARAGSGRPPARTDVGGGRPLSRQTPESQFPGAASTTGKGGGGWGQGEGRGAWGVGGELRSQLWLFWGGTERKPSVRSKSDTKGVLRCQSGILAPPSWVIGNKLSP